MEKMEKFFLENILMSDCMLNRIELMYSFHVGIILDNVAVCQCPGAGVIIVNWVQKI